MRENLARDLTIRVVSGILDVKPVSFSGMGGRTAVDLCSLKMGSRCRSFITNRNNFPYVTQKACLVPNILSVPLVFKLTV